MPAIQILRFTSTDALLIDHTVLSKNGIELLASADGVISAYFGIQEEDKRTAYLFVVWKSYEQHKKLMDEPDYPSKIHKLFERAAKSPLDHKHIEISNADIDVAARVFDSPITEMLQANPKPAGGDDAAFVKELGQLGAEISKGKGWRGAVRGRCKEDPRIFISILGWDSVKAHEVVAGSGNIPQIAERVNTLRDVRITHVALKKLST